jgi:hypothetical protein
VNAGCGPSYPAPALHWPGASRQQLRDEVRRWLVQGGLAVWWSPSYRPAQAESYRACTPIEKGSASPKRHRARRTKLVRLSPFHSPDLCSRRASPAIWTCPPEAHLQLFELLRTFTSTGSDRSQRGRNPSSGNSRRRRRAGSPPPGEPAIGGVLHSAGR